MKYVSGRIVRGIYTWLGWSGEVAEPIGSSVPVRAHYCGRERCPVVILPKFRLPRKFRDLLHAVNLRHGTDGFTSPPKEGVMRIFSPQNSDGFGRV